MKEKQRILKILRNIHKHALEGGDDLLMHVTDVALALAQDRSPQQVMMILQDHDLLDFENNE